MQALIYGVGNVITKVAYESITPFWSMTIRFGIASLIFFLFYGKHVLLQLKNAHYMQWLLPAICMACCYITCGVALDLTSATNVGFLMSLPVVFTPFLAVIVLHRPYRLRNIPIQIAIIIGLYLLCSNGAAFSFGLGELLATVCAVAGAGAFVFGERSLKTLDEITVSAVQVWMSFLLSIPCSVLFEGKFNVADVTVGAWLTVLYLAILCTMVAFRLQNFTLTKISAQSVAIILCLEPILTAILSRIVLGEVLTVMGMIGGGIIVACVIVGNLVEDTSDSGKVEITK